MNAGYALIGLSASLSRDVGFSSGFFASLLIFLIGVTSPGPSNLAVAATGLSQGRKAAVALALGVSFGSLALGLLVAFGVTSLLSAHPLVLGLATLLVAAHLLWAAFRALRSQCTDEASIAKACSLSLLKTFLAGTLLHLGNPKALFVWTAVLMTVLTPADSTYVAFSIVVSFSALGALIFIGYGLLFSSATASRLNSRYQRKLRVTLGVIFAVAGLSLMQHAITLLTS